MAILENLENAWDDDFNQQETTDWHKPGTFYFESSPIKEEDNMGREKFWEDLGRPQDISWSAKIFSENCCSECLCD